LSLLVKEPATDQSSQQERTQPSLNLCVHNLC
jgi:hypothetical protein